MAKGCLTVRRTCRAGAKAGHSDPVVLYGRAIAQRIKGTPGITGLSLPRAHIDGVVWHLDVGSSHPGAGAGPKGLAVRQLKWYVSWVQNVARQFGPYLPWASILERSCPSYERTGMTMPVVSLSWRQPRSMLAMHGRDNR